MFSPLDTFMINRATRAMRWLNESVGLSAPKVLREALMAFMASYAAFGLVVLSTGDLIASAAVIIFGSMLYPTLFGVLRRYSADADKDWSSTLAMKYMAQAIGKQEGMRAGRALGWVSVVLYPTCLWIGGAPQTSFFTYVYFAAMISGLGYEYLAAAEPSAPGERRHAAELQLAHASTK